MNDRELLELAAKASGFAAHQWDEGMQAMRSPAKVTKYGDAHSYWNPLADDGDALRLAAKLKIDLEWQNLDPFPEPAIEAYRREGDSYFIASEHEDNYRRAIVRAAAEIARAADAGGKEGQP